MKNPSNNLLVKLYSWARRQRQGENFTTEAFAHFLTQLQSNEGVAEREVASRLICWLLDEQTQDTRLRPEGVNKLTIEAQRSFDEDRPDLVISTSDLLVFVEVKLHSPFHENQLENYYKKLLDQDGHTYRRLVTLTLYPLTKTNEALATSEEIKLVSRRWMELGDFLDKVDTSCVAAESSFLFRQFKDFIEQEGFVMEHVDEELVSGMKAFRHLMKMLDQSLRKCKLKAERSASRSEVGFHVLNRKFFLGLNVERPDVLVFKTRPKAVTIPDGTQVNHGKIWTKQKERRWSFELDLDSGFFKLTKTDQFDRLIEFIDTAQYVAKELTSTVS